MLLTKPLLGPGAGQTEPALFTTCPLIAMLAVCHCRCGSMPGCRACERRGRVRTRGRLRCPCRARWGCRPWRTPVCFTLPSFSTTDVFPRQPHRFVFPRQPHRFFLPRQPHRFFLPRQPHPFFFPRQPHRFAMRPAVQSPLNCWRLKSTTS